MTDFTYSGGNGKCNDLAVLIGIPQAWVYTADQPAGWTCPGAYECVVRCDRKTGKLRKGKGNRYDCFQGILESRPNVRKLRWANFDAMVECGRAQHVVPMADKLTASVPKNATIVRISASGDMFTEAYLMAWILTALRRPDVRFYGYTKSAHMLPARDEMPRNLALTVTAGGKYDDYALDYPRAYVVDNLAEALELQAKHPRLIIAHEDECVMSELAVIAGRPVALIIHGTQAPHINARIKAKQG